MHTAISINIIMAISWLPSLISQLFSPILFKDQGHRKIFNLWVPSSKAEGQKKKYVASVTALLDSLTALLEYLDLFSNI